MKKLRPPRLLGLILAIALLPVLYAGCVQPEEAGERLAGILTDPDATTFENEPWYHAPHVLFPGMGEHSLDPMYVTFHGTWTTRRSWTPTPTRTSWEIGTSSTYRWPGAR